MLSPTLGTPTLGGLRLREPATAEARLRVTVLRSPQALAALAPAWEDLAAHALEPNPFYEPWMLLPALQAPRAPLEAVLVHAEPADGSVRLAGLFPLERLPRYRGLPLSVLRLWHHPHCFLRTPLLRRGCEQEALAAFFGWLARDSGASLLQMHDVPSDGPFQGALARELERPSRRAYRAVRYARALFRPRGSAQEYLRAALGGRRRKEFRRLARRLAERGALAYRALGAGEDAAAWIRDFLELEARGWKGRAGTALASAAADRAYFENVARAAAQRGRLEIHGLFLDGRAIALSCKMRAGDGAFAFKIAFDEAYAEYSPGALLELAHIKRMHVDARLRWLDSCAAPDHFMANRLWRERRVLQSVTVAAGFAGRLVIALLPWLRRAPRPPGLAA
jgi:CelD/BcsL family acetyltransferase involved in cellulose biosynthesis